MLHLALFCQDASKNIHLLIPEIPCKTGHSGAKQGETNNDKNTIYMPWQYTGNGLMKCLERLILLDFSAIRQRGKVEFRPGLDHLKCVKNETKIIKWEVLYVILFM